MNDHDHRGRPHYPQQVPHHGWVGHPPPRPPSSGVPRALIIVLSIVGFVVLGSCSVCSYVINRAGDAMDDVTMRALEEHLEEQVAADEVKAECRDGKAQRLSEIAEEGEAAWDGRCIKAIGTVKHGDPVAPGESPDVELRADDGDSPLRLRCPSWRNETNEPPREGQRVVVVGRAYGVYGDPMTADFCEWTGAPAT